MEETPPSGDPIVYFDEILSLIPPKHYFPVTQDETKWNSKFAKNVKGIDAAEQKVKRQAAKRKFDPEEASKTLEERQKEHHKKQKKEQEARLQRDVVSFGQGVPEGEFVESSDEEVCPPQEAVTVDDSNINNAATAATTTGGNVLDQDLRSQLQQKIAALKERRKAAAPDDKTAREKLRQKRQKRRENKSKEAKKKQEKKDSQDTSNNKRKLLPGEKSGHEDGVSKRRRTSDIDYSTFDYSTGRAVPKYLAAASMKKKDPRKLLREAEERKERVEKLRASKDQAALSALALDNAMKRASGEIIKDDPKRIKKGLKRRQKAKERSKAAWDERKEVTKSLKEKKQKRREENISKYRGKNATHKSKGVRKGKGAGFEGRKKQFLNK